MSGPMTEPREALATKADDAPDMRNISRCWQNQGWHPNGAGPCFESREEAVAFRDYEDEHGSDAARRKWGLR